MTTLDKVIQRIGKTGQVPDLSHLSRREVAKMRRTSKPIHRTPLTQMMQGPREHKTKMRWPVRDQTFVLETERVTRNLITVENPLITARRRNYPKTR